jgi:hypothetical protein
MTKPDEALQQTARSGFPFQLRVEEEIRSTHKAHGWSVASREHPWVHPESRHTHLLFKKISVTVRFLIQ